MVRAIYLSKLGSGLFSVASPLEGSLWGVSGLYYGAFPGATTSSFSSPFPFVSFLAHIDTKSNSTNTIDQPCVLEQRWSICVLLAVVCHEVGSTPTEPIIPNHTTAATPTLV